MGKINFRICLDMKDMLLGVQIYTTCVIEFYLFYFKLNGGYVVFVVRLCILFHV